MTWRERIAAARERGSFTSDERIHLAHAWATCAVGEQHQQHPDVVVYVPYERLGSFFPGMKPEDERLEELGGDSGFFRAVRANNFDEAERLLDAIEDRVLELKRGKA